MCVVGAGGHRRGLYIFLRICVVTPRNLIDLWSKWDNLEEWDLQRKG